MPRGCRKSTRSQTGGAAEILIINLMTVKRWQHMLSLTHPLPLLSVPSNPRTSYIYNTSLILLLLAAVQAMMSMTLQWSTEFIMMTASVNGHIMSGQKECLSFCLYLSTQALDQGLYILVLTPKHVEYVWQHDERQVIPCGQSRPFPGVKVNQLPQRHSFQTAFTVESSHTWVICIF